MKKQMPKCCDPIPLPYLDDDNNVLPENIHTHYTFRQWFQGNPSTGAVLIRSRIYGFENHNIDRIIVPALRHIRDVIAFNGPGPNGPPPTFFQNGNYIRRELRLLEPRVESGELTMPLELNGILSQEAHVMGGVGVRGLYGYLDDDLNPPHPNSEEWNDIFIYQINRPEDPVLGRAEVNYYHRYRHFNIQLNEALMAFDGPEDIRKWASVIFHEMMHNYGWTHDDNTAERIEYIYHADQILERLVPVDE